MAKKTWIQEIIDSAKPLFKAYPELEVLPFYAWGRYYKYELAGDPFEEHAGGEMGITAFQEMLKGHSEYYQQIGWKLLKQIDKKHNIQGGEIWTGKWLDYSPDRSKAVRKYNFDERGGKCLLVIKENNKYKVVDTDCSSSE